MEQQGPPPAYDVHWSQVYGKNQTEQAQPMTKQMQDQCYSTQEYLGHGVACQQQQGAVFQQPYAYPYANYVIPPSFHGPPPDNYSVLAWLTCLFCCWPLGLVAIVKSFEVNTALNQGDINRARHASQSAKKFGLASLGCGIANGVLTIFLIIFFLVIFPHMIALDDGDINR